MDQLVFSVNNLEQITFDMYNPIKDNINLVPNTDTGVKDYVEIYYYNLINDDIEEKNIEGIQKQKRLIKDYLINSNIPQQEKKMVHLKNDTLLGRKLKQILYTDGFYIEGYKIKYDFTKVYCNFIYDIDFYVGNRYISSKLKDIYLLLKDKFDIVPKYTNITQYQWEEYEYEPNKYRRRKIESSKYIYKVIEYLEITKDKQKVNLNLELIDDIKNRMEEYVECYLGSLDDYMKGCIED